MTLRNSIGIRSLETAQNSRIVGPVSMQLLTPQDDENPMLSLSDSLLLINIEQTFSAVV